jgi:hypothetical protein
LRCNARSKLDAGSRLGGNIGQTLLGFVGWDGFVTSRDVVACLRDGGLDISEEAKLTSDPAKVQAQFNAWARQTSLPYVHLSRICALSVGENCQPQIFRSRRRSGPSTPPTRHAKRDCFVACAPCNGESNVTRADNQSRQN